VLAVIVIRQALPILCAAAMAWLGWSVTHDLAGAGVASIAAFLVALWLLDVATSHGITRRLTVRAEIVATAFVAGGLAFLAVGGPIPHLI
jgi:hypothetical protein